MPRIGLWIGCLLLAPGPAAAESQEFSRPLEWQLRHGRATLTVAVADGFRVPLETVDERIEYDFAFELDFSEASILVDARDETEAVESETPRGRILGLVAFDSPFTKYRTRDLFIEAIAEKIRELAAPAFREPWAGYTRYANPFLEPVGPEGAPLGTRLVICVDDGRWPRCSTVDTVSQNGSVDRSSSALADSDAEERLTASIMHWLRDVDPEWQLDTPLDLLVLSREGVRAEVVARTELPPATLPTGAAFMRIESTAVRADDESERRHEVIPANAPDARLDPERLASSRSLLVGWSFFATAPANGREGERNESSNPVLFGVYWTARARVSDPGDLVAAVAERLLYRRSPIGQSRLLELLTGADRATAPIPGEHFRVICVADGDGDWMATYRLQRASGEVLNPAEVCKRMAREIASAEESGSGKGQ